MISLDTALASFLHVGALPSNRRNMPCLRSRCHRFRHARDTMRLCWDLRYGRRLSNSIQTNKRLTYTMSWMKPCRAWWQQFDVKSAAPKAV